MLFAIKIYLQIIEDFYFVPWLYLIEGHTPTNFFAIKNIPVGVLD